MDMHKRCTIILEQASRIRLQLESIQEPGKAIEKYRMIREDRSRLMAQEVDRQPKFFMLMSQMLQSERR